MATSSLLLEAHEPLLGRRCWEDGATASHKAAQNAVTRPHLPPLETFKRLFLGEQREQV